MDMGTGKTITSLSLTKGKKILVVCLATKVKDWAEDICELLPDYKVQTLNKGTKRNRELLHGFDALIVSFESSWRIDKELLKLINNDWYVIVDESHKIKSRTSKVGRFMRKLAKRTDYKMILTGTPQHKKYIDYYNQLYFIGALNMTYKEFEAKYCITMDVNYNGFPKREIIGYRNAVVLDRLIQRTCAFYRRDYDTYEAPSDIVVKLKKPRVYNQIIRDRYYEDILCDSQSTLRLRLKQAASGFIGPYDLHDNKIDWLRDFLDTYTERVVIFYNFNAERDKIKTLLDKIGRPYSEYSGAVKDLTNFKNFDNGVAVCNFKTGSTGINDLVISNMCVYYSLTDYYIEFAQSKKRIDRIGQTKQPVYYYLLTEGTIDVKIKNALDRGQDFDDKQFSMEGY